MGCHNVFAVLCIEATSQTNEALSRQRRSTSPTLVGSEPKLSGVRSIDPVAGDHDEDNLLTPQDLEDLLTNLDQQITSERGGKVDKRDVLHELTDSNNNKFSDSGNRDDSEGTADVKEKSSWWFW